MVYNRFGIQVAMRLVLAVAAGVAGVYLLVRGGTYVLPIFLLGLMAALTFSLIRYASKTNQKLTGFLQSIRYSDFTISFTRDTQLGSRFPGLNEAFNDVIADFQKARAESEESLRYLNTVVKHIGTGLIAYDPQGSITLINNAARRQLGLIAARHIDELQGINPELWALLQKMQTGDKTLVHVVGTEEKQLTFRTTEFKLRSQVHRLVAIQNIKPELDAKELEAWRNLTRVLRHEIMNSITPIASLSNTIRALAEAELARHEEAASEDLIDIREGLLTIERRSLGLIEFVDAYRTYTNLPTPVLATIQVDELFAQVARLLRESLQQHGITLVQDIDPPGLTLQADVGLIEMVLLNLGKNAIEAFGDTASPRIVLLARPAADGHCLLQVVDNGPGIVEEALDQIFIPFFTTKKGGSGIGLAWSKQVLQLHGGTLTAASQPEVETTFTLYL